jgi:hypothetical protein
VEKKLIEVFMVKIRLMELIIEIDFGEWICGRTVRL